ncbi:MAG TPA: class I SAM-dependent methyltransferase [Sphingomicrobium sp.]|nr:class I SAM-dependent methyltransferase [Sphingomicrobium sp.]
MSEAALHHFAREYGRFRAEEGRGYRGRTLFELPYVRSGPHAGQWAVRSRTFDAFMAEVLLPAASQSVEQLTVMDLGAGNGWLSYRIASEGHRAIAIDIRDDSVDGLGAADPFLKRAHFMRCLIASFDAVPLPSASVDIAVFNASLHYATDLHRVLAEAQRLTKPGGQIAILDSPFYRSEAEGAAMVAEKRRKFGKRAELLMALPFVEFLTVQRLREAAPDLAWVRHKVRYGLAYELRPFLAAIRGKRRPSRFDLWVARRP